MAIKKWVTITINVDPKTWLAFKNKAKKEGIPYQSIINTLIDQYANDEIHITL